MKLLLGIALGLLAGCASQPSADRSGQEAVTTGLTQAPGAPVTAACTGLALLRRGNPLCLGVEYLPPAGEEESLAPDRLPVQAELMLSGPAPAPRQPDRTPLWSRERTERHTWAMTAEDLAQVRDPVERETLHFVEDLMGEDRRRLRRDIGTPILTMQASDMQSPGIDLAAEEVQAEEEAQWMAEHGVDLLRRPLQMLLRRLPLVQQLEIDLDEFKQDNVPLTEEYGRAHDVADLGRVSMRVHAGDPKDPIELVYLRSGIRIGSSQSQLKLGYARHLAKAVTLEIHTRQNYDDRTWRVRADLSWELSPRTSLHFVAGDNLDFLTTSTVYSLFESPMDGSPGLLIYAVHLF